MSPSKSPPEGAGIPPSGPDLTETIRSIVRDELSRTNPVEEQLTLRQTANLLDVCNDTVYNWRRRGLLVSYRQNGRIYFKKHEVEAAKLKAAKKSTASPSTATS